MKRRQFIQMSLASAAAGTLATQMLTAENVVAAELPTNTIKSYCIDFNWGSSGSGKPFAKPGLWADADPQKHIQWYKELGCNDIQTFCVSCNGYAWYKGGVVPEQPDLKHDFVSELVQLGHKEKMTVFGYFCVGANSRWGKLHPDESYGTPTRPHIPLTNRYLDYLSSAIKDAVQKTGVDGIHMDWLWNPSVKDTNQWLPCEQEMYAELMEESFPGINNVTQEQTNDYQKKAINRCWKRIYEAAKENNKNCLVWLTCNDLNKPEIAGSPMWQQVDWLLNERGDIKTIKENVSKVGKQTRFLTCLAAWNGQDAVKTVRDAAEAGIDIGLYGYTKPGGDSLPQPVRAYLSQPVDSFKGDARNIATLVRIYNGHPLDYVAK